jgi:quinol monooxygenase YgiN
MIIVIGHVVAREDTEAQVQRLAVEHVLRSRSEPGCVSHEVSRDVQQPLRFVFVERWSDMAALQAHFRVDASRKFAQAADGHLPGRSRSHGVTGRRPRAAAAPHTLGP